MTLLAGATMAGKILFNGNMGSLSLLMQRVRPFVRGKCLMVTAAWGPGELGDAPIREALNAVGIPSDWRGGYDQNIKNLCAWHCWNAYLQRHPHVARVEKEMQLVGAETRGFYLEKTSFHSRRVRHAVRSARSRIPGFSLGALPTVPRDALRPEVTLGGTELLGWALTRELVHELADLTQHDARMMEALAEVEGAVATRTGLYFDPDWQEQRRTLEARLLEADTIFLLGGEPGELLGALRFFDLKGALQETLRRGAVVVAISAGSLVLCERMIVYNDYAPEQDKREFRLFDRGLGIVGGLQILPHCMDRIQTDDADNLAYLARRFSSHACVGLNEESFLLVDLEKASATSVGTRDGVYVFGADGVKRCYHRGEQVPL